MADQNGSSGTSGAAGVNSPGVGGGLGASGSGISGTGGNGSAGGVGTGGGVGGAGGSAATLSGAVDNTDTLTGGGGGDGGNGGSAIGGGGGTGTNGGGNTGFGGTGGAGGRGGDGGNGNDGGTGASVSAPATVTNSGAIAGGGGGRGGDGGSARGGLGGLGSNGINNNGTGGTGGVGGIGGDAGDGGTGGAGITFAVQGNTLVNNGTISGGAGGAAGTAGSAPGGPAGRGINGSGTGQSGIRGADGVGGDAGRAGTGGVGVIGADLTIVNNGSISGGLPGDDNAAGRADAITFTGGTNSLTLGGTLDGGIGVTGTLTLVANADRTLGNAIHDAPGGTGALVYGSASTLSLSSPNTYAGGTTVQNGILALTAAGAAGSGAITFSASSAGFATLALSGTAQPGAGGTFANTLTDFGAGDLLDLQGLAYSADASATVAGGLLEITTGGTTRSFALGGTPAAAYTVAKDAADGSTLVGVAKLGLVTATDGAAHDPANDTDVPLVVYGGTGLSYTATTATVNGHLILTLGNGKVREAIDLGTTPKGLGLDFSTNIAAVSLTGGDSGDALRGGSAADALTGGAGKDLLEGGAGGDTLTGLGGSDRYIVDNAGDRVIEAAGGGTEDRVYVAGNVAFTSYTLAAGQEVETLATTRGVSTRPLDLTGNEKGQTICGNQGANVLDGKDGTDTLNGYSGADTFVFSTALGADNVDRIVDFTSADTIRLEKSVFSALDLGTLDAGAFKDLSVAGATIDADDRILYDAKGRLFYDADGAGGADAVLFAKLSYRPALSHDDFLIA